MNVRAAIILTVVSFLGFLPVIGLAQKPSDRSLPLYVRFVEDYPSVETFEMSDSLFFQNAGSIVFKVREYTMNPNDSLLRELDDWILPTMKQQDWELVSIALRGAASPEGPYSLNQWLSKQRAKALTDFILERMEQTYQDLMTTNTTAEDYRNLIYLMEQANDPSTARVRELLARCKDDSQAKNALRKADKGKLWRYLLKEYFPKLRAARVMLFFKRKHPTPILTGRQPSLAILPKLSEIDELIILPPTIEPQPEPLPAEEEDLPHLLAIGTNMLYDAFYMPNFGWAPSPSIQLEYYPVESRWTYLAQFTFPYYTRWAKHKFFEIRDYHLEVRRYFSPLASQGLDESNATLHTGLFAAAYLNANKYGIGFSKTKGWQGEGFGGALKAGYVWPLSRSGRWRLEASAAIGGYVTRFDPYVYGNPLSGEEDGDYYYDYTGNASDFQKRNYRRVWFGPTELNLTLRYDLLYRGKRGATLKRKEVAE